MIDINIRRARNNAKKGHYDQSIMIECEKYLQYVETYEQPITNDQLAKIPVTECEHRIRGLRSIVYTDSTGRIQKIDFPENCSTSKFYSKVNIPDLKRSVLFDIDFEGDHTVFFTLTGYLSEHFEIDISMK